MNRLRVTLFLAIKLLFSSIFYFLVIRSGHMGGGWGAYVAGLMLHTCELLVRNLKTIGWSWRTERCEAVGCCTPLAYSAISDALVWLTGIGTFFNKEFVAKFTQSFDGGPLPDWFSIALYFFFIATLGVIRDTATVIGKEIGWRGFLVPELAKRQSFATTAAITGLIWPLRH